MPAPNGKFRRTRFTKIIKTNRSLFRDTTPRAFRQSLVAANFHESENAPEAGTTLPKMVHRLSPSP
jgi:hypothetical protein